MTFCCLLRLRVLSSFVRVRLFSAPFCLKPVTCHVSGHVTAVALLLLYNFISIFDYIMLHFMIL